MQALETAGTDVLGLVATMVPSKKPDGYSYGYGYGYGRAATTDAVDSSPGNEQSQAAEDQELRGAHAK